MLMQRSSVGNYYIFVFDDYETEPSSENYCNPSLYKFALGVTITFDILMALSAIWGGKKKVQNNNSVGDGNDVVVNVTGQAPPPVVVRQAAPQGQQTLHP